MIIFFFFYQGGRMLSNGQEIILFLILLIVGLIYLNKYFKVHKVEINKFIFTASILREIVIIFLEEPSKSNISTNINPVIWVLYIAVILFYKILKDEEYEFSYFSLFWGANILGTSILNRLYVVLRLLFLDKELIIKSIFLIVGSGLLSGFLYTFFMECCLKKNKGEGMAKYFSRYVKTLDTLILFQFLSSSYSFLSFVNLLVLIIYFGKDKEDKFGYFLLYSLINFMNYIYF